MVVEKEKLFENDEFQGFISSKEMDFIGRILNEHKYVLRDEKLEFDSFLKQIIPYVIIINPKSKKVFGYKRFKKREGYREMRLHDKFSIGVGGHVDKEEIAEDVLRDATMRELREEIKMENYPIPKIVGFVNDNNDSVGQVHFGVIAIAETNEEISKREGDEVREEKFYSIEEVDSLMNSGVEMDGWTRICWAFVKGYLQGLV